MKQVLALFVLCSVGLASAQVVFADGMTDLKGRFTVRGGGYSQQIELREIQPGTDGKFKAKLSIWTAKTSCALRGVAIEGVVSGEEFAIEGANPNCWNYKIVGRPAKDHKFVGTLSTDGNVSDFHLD